MHVAKRSVGLLGTGCYLPTRVVTNEELSDRWRTSSSAADAFLGDTGVLERRVCAPDETSSSMAVRAGLDAIRNAGMAPNDIDLVLTASLPADQIQPTNAALVSHRLGAVRALALEVDAACASLVVQMVVASAMIQQGLCRSVCCIASTAWTGFADYTSADGWLMGDGASALVLGCVEGDRGIRGHHIDTDGQHWDAIGITRCRPKGAPEQGERTLFRIADEPDALAWLMETAPRMIPEVVHKALANAALGREDIGYFVPHNPGRDLPRLWARRLGVGDRYHVTIQKYGNMSAASIGVNLHESIQDGRIRPGDVVAMAAPGAGFYHAGLVLKL